ncbi:adenylyltransferase and sulfurtransferase MOCS3-like [Lycorma delicatula]|uniref:adenylyltransferase and sulfurtransferase MOCS3-like n=1 Tax=Lycorma delicatula TaxID=130591 RepID=UPI003F515422
MCESERSFLLLVGSVLAGQTRLKTSSVLIIGAGGLGCPAALYLVGTGIGIYILYGYIIYYSNIISYMEYNWSHIGLVDYDVVEENNLHRQLLHDEGSIGKPKVTSAAEALKSPCSNWSITSIRSYQSSSGSQCYLGPRLLLFDGSYTQFRNVKLQSKNGDCVVCGTSPTITELIDYVEFCGSSPNDKDKGIKLLNDDERITAQELARKMESDEKFVLLDVRSNSEFEICALPDSVMFLYQ